MGDYVFYADKLRLVTVGLRARVLGLQTIIVARILGLRGLAWRDQLGVVAVGATKIAAAQKGVFAAPTVIFYKADGSETARAHNVAELEEIFNLETA